MNRDSAPVERAQDYVADAGCSPVVLVPNHEVRALLLGELLQLAHVHVPVLQVLHDRRDDRVQLELVAGELEDLHVLLAKSPEACCVGEGRRELAVAVAGVLPMFGFPTKSRSLYHLDKGPFNYSKVADVVLTDRSLEFAIWSFSPGTEVIKDKKIYTVGAFAHYYPSKGGLALDEKPLGDPYKLSKCISPDCLTMFSEVIDTCKICKNDCVPLIFYQPRGFKTVGGVHDYEENRFRPAMVPKPELVFDENPKNEKDIQKDPKIHDKIS